MPWETSWTPAVSTSTSPLPVVPSRNAFRRLSPKSRRTARRSTDPPLGLDDEQQTLAETFGADDDNYEKVLNIQTVWPLIAALRERQRMVLAFHFFHNVTQTEIAKRIGSSQVRTLRRQADEWAVHAREPELADTA